MSIKKIIRNSFSMTMGMLAFTLYSQGNTSPVKTSQDPPPGTITIDLTPKVVFPKGKDIDPQMVGREQGNYKIKVKIKGLKNKPLYLADNFGERMYYRDTAFLNDKGEGEFTGNPKLQRGIYMFVMPTLDGYFEVPITDDQEFYFEADTTYDETKIIAKGAPEVEAFVQFRKLTKMANMHRAQLDQQLKAEQDPAKAALIRASLDSMAKISFNYSEDYIKDNPNHLLTKVLKAFMSVKVPENPNPKDSMFGFNYYRYHYWDNIDFAESGLIRAPQGLLIRKLDEFIDRLSFQDPDSLVSSIEIVMSKTIPYTEIQRYFIQYITNKFQDKKIMCMDNVTVHMINKYYCEGDAWWYNDSAGRMKMCIEAKRAIPTLCGKQAPNLNIADTAGIYHKLYDNLGQNYTILFFYDPTCGHCKQVIPIVNAVYHKHKKNGIRVYAVSTENKYTEWIEMMRKRPELHDWVNVCKSNMFIEWKTNRYNYNIQANPTIMILDANAKIVGKKIDEHQLEFFIESLLFEKGIIKTKPELPKEKPASDSDHGPDDGHGHSGSATIKNENE